MRLKKIITKTLLAGAIASLALFAHHQTRGFRLYLILSNLPADPRWETPPLPENELAHINTLLSQRFTFIGSGGWCYAFLGEDQKTVLKFFRHTHLAPRALLTNFSLGKLFLKSPILPTGTPCFQEFNFKSYLLAHQTAPERTALLYLHLNQTEGKHGSVTLIDPSKVEHTISLDKTEFVVQERATLVLPYLTDLMENHKVEQAKEAIDDLLDCLLSFYKQDVKDLDLGLKNNFGFTTQGAIALDLSSFVTSDNLDPSKELAHKTQRLGRWLRKNHPVLYAHYLKKLSQDSSPAHGES